MLWTWHFTLIHYYYFGNISFLPRFYDTVIFHHLELIVLYFYQILLWIRNSFFRRFVIYQILIFPIYSLSARIKYSLAWFARFPVFAVLSCNLVLVHIFCGAILVLDLDRSCKTLASMSSPTTLATLAVLSFVTSFTTSNLDILDEKK